MTETFRNVRIDEIPVLRIVCQNEKCGAIFQLSLSRVSHGAENILCPGCGIDLLHGHRGRDEDAFKALANAMRELANEKHFRVELPIKMD